jgi:hypothetical protein
MLAVFLQSAPFFALIGLGYLAGRSGFFPDEATGYLTKFVFYFALSAMLFGFAANLSLGDILDLRFLAAYVWASFLVWSLVTAVALLRRRPMAEAVVEAQCGVVGNTGFLGVPMLVILLGDGAVGPVLMVLAADLVVFASLFAILITISREGRVSLSLFRSVALGVVRNPMVVSIALGMAWSALSLPLPGPANEFLGILGAAATPCALFAIGASLASKSAERIEVAAWLSTAKLILHPAAAAVSALVIFRVEPFSAMVMIAAAALPVAGNVYILARQYGAAPQRVSASILISHVAGVVTIPVIIAWAMGN